MFGLYFMCQQWLNKFASISNNFRRRRWPVPRFAPKFKKIMREKLRTSLFQILCTVFSAIDLRAEGFFFFSLSNILPTSPPQALINPMRLAPEDFDRKLTKRIRPPNYLCTEALLCSFFFFFFFRRSSLRILLFDARSLPLSVIRGILLKRSGFAELASFSRLTTATVLIYCDSGDRWKCWFMPTSWGFPKKVVKRARFSATLATTGEWRVGDVSPKQTFWLYKYYFVVWTAMDRCYW